MGSTGSGRLPGSAAVSWTVRCLKRCDLHFLGLVGGGDSVRKPTNINCLTILKLCLLSHPLSRFPANESRAAPICALSGLREAEPCVPRAQLSSPVPAPSFQHSPRPAQTFLLFVVLKEEGPWTHPVCPSPFPMNGVHCGLRGSYAFMLSQ